MTSDIDVRPPDYPISRPPIYDNPTRLVTPNPGAGEAASAPLASPPSSALNASSDASPSTTWPAAPTISGLSPTQQKFLHVDAIIVQQEQNVKTFATELRRSFKEHDSPDTNMLSNVLATAGGQRSPAFAKMPLEVQAIIDRFESPTRPQNVADAGMLALSGHSARGQFMIEIARAKDFIRQLEQLRDSLSNQIEAEQNQ